MNRAAFAAIAVLAVACQQAPDDDDDRENVASEMVTEADSMHCGGGRSEIHTNYTDFSETMHIRVHNACYTDINDSLGNAGPAVLRVLDEQGNVVNQQEMTVLAGQKGRGTFSVPGKGRVELVCGRMREERGKCHWSYSYSP